MTRLRVVFVAAAAVLIAAGLAVAGANRNFSVHLTGDFEVPVRDTQAQGQATFKLGKDGESLDYKLNVANIENVIMAHIHRGDPTVAGPIVVWLYPSTAPGPPAAAGGGRISGRIVSGTITSDDLVGPLAGGELSDLVELLQTGQAYVNVHTDDGVAPPNSGAGDFPGGEIRGNF
jgi:CHRD domain-containing protein